VKLQKRFLAEIVELAALATRGQAQRDERLRHVFRHRKRVRIDAGKGRQIHAGTGRARGEQIGALNRWFEEALSSHPPPAVSGRRLKLNYITQAKTRPPSFVVFCTRADAVPDAYKRYLTNSLRETFDLPGTPIRLTLREKANPFNGRARRKK
jgi:predicted GTPase